METQPMPNETPKILTSMGSVFGTQLTGFALVTEGGAAAPTIATNLPIVQPNDLLSQNVMTLQNEVRDLKIQIEEIKGIISKPVAPVSVTPPQPLIVTSADVPNPLAPVVKKKAGRPKKVLS